MSEVLSFGTDGVRGRAGEGILSEDNIERLGFVLGEWLTKDGPTTRPVILGGDTRDSRQWIATALAQGLAQQGFSVLDLGVIPTAALALLAEDYNAACSLVISASHNPAADNGIKVFAAGAGKLGDTDTAWIERCWRDQGFQPGSKKAELEVQSDAGERFLTLLVEKMSGLQLAGRRIALDLAHGAAYQVGPELFRRLGAEVISMGDAPNGQNINERCGSLHPQSLAQMVVDSGADFGVAVDGDADRSIFVDETGRIVDGDGILAAMAHDLRQRQQLPGGTVVGTVMTNFGLELFLRRRGIELERTSVGDRFISARLREAGLALGGEPSGHLIFGAELQFLGDGLYTALRVADLIVRSEAPLSACLQDLVLLPQTQVGVRVSSRPPLDEISGFREKLAHSDERLSGEGRVVVRYSGTEPLVRVMVEGADLGLVQEIADDLADFLTAQIGEKAP